MCQAVSSVLGIDGGEKRNRVPTFRALTVSKGRQTSLKSGSNKNTMVTGVAVPNACCSGTLT